MVAAVSGLAERGYIGQFLGSKNPEKNTGQQTRIWPTAPLTEFLKANYSISWDNFKDIGTGETIILKDEDKKEIDYEDDAATNKMRATLNAYNKLLRTSDISLPSNDAEVQMALTERPLDFSVRHYHRVFNNGRFDRGGRFYGPWWQQASGDLRKHILINGNPTVELDYSAMHIHILYSREGKNYYKLFPAGDDPYSLPSYGDHERKVLKFAILIALNVSSERKGLPAIRKKLNEEGLYKTGMKLKPLLKAFCEIHPTIKHYLYSEVGLETQFTDSGIAEYVIKKFTTQGTPCLCVHDSFIVEKMHEARLKKLMVTAFRVNKFKSIPLIK